MTRSPATDGAPPGCGPGGLWTADPPSSGVGSWAQATSWPAGAQGWSVARRARTVSQDSRVVAGSGGVGMVAAAPGGTGGSSRGPEATWTPSSSRDQVKARWDRSSDVVQVGDADAAGRVGGDADRLDDLLELGQAGRGGAVGEQQAVGDEVAVVEGLAEVAAVGEELGPVVGAGPQAVVDPLPHEPALAARVALEQVLVLPEAAGPVAHGVAVLAEDERHGPAPGVQPGVVQRRLLAAADGVDLGVAGVHAAVDVDVRARPVALVVQRPRRVALPGPGGHGGQVGAGAALVAERPHDHAGVVLVPLDHAGHPVDQGVAPARVGDRVAPPADQLEPVGLQVALVDHVQPVGVAQLQEPGVGRVVAGPDGVEVVALHQQDVGQHHLLGHGPAQVGVELVAVDPAEQHPAAVDPEQPVADLDRPEADPQGHPLAGRGEPALVQPGRLGRPGRHRREPDRLAGGDVDPELGHGQAGRDVGVDPQGAGAGLVVVAGVDEPVPDRPGRAGQQPHLPEDPGQPPHVLVLQVAGGRPLPHPHRQEVVPAGKGQGGGGVELDRQPAAGRAAQLPAVEPHLELRVDPLEPQHGPLGLPVAGQAEPDPVVAGRVVAWDVRRVDRERVGDVGVGGGAVAVELPVRRHRQGGPAGVVEAGVGEPGVGVGPRRQPEPPAPRQLERPGVRGRPGPRGQGPGAHPQPAAGAHAPVAWSRRACSGRSTGSGRPTSARTRPPRVTRPASSQGGAIACLVSGLPATATGSTR